MSASSKKITYTSEFKLKVLDYYFKHGGDENFGLKTKTASHFNIDKKTINRMLNNPEMVKRARCLLAKRHSSSKSSPSTSSSTTFKPSKSGKSIKKVVAAGGRVTGGSGKAASASAAGVTAASGSGGSGAAGTSGGSSAAAAAGSAAAAATSSSRVRCVGGQGAAAEGVKVFELPEDPDYSLLKRSINASANGVANMAKLLVTGTEEVRKLILNECDVILECKVCQNLFRSIVNFLAHKRIYCQETFADVRTLFHRDNTQGVTSQSGTVVVEPEEPPPSPPPPPDLDARPVTPPHASARDGGRGSRRIDSIADRLAGRQWRGTSSQSSVSDFASAASHPSHTGSAKYYERLQLVNAARDKLSQDCSVVLEDIRGVSNARLQTYQPQSSTSSTATTPLPPMSQQLLEVSQRTSGVSVALGERGEIVKTARGDVEAMDVEKPASSKQSASQGQDLLCRLCNTRFATTKTLSVHQRSFHGLERHVYSCPICKTSFITIWGVVKHLEKVHKKTKHQTDRLKRVIRKNVTKKLFFPTTPDPEGEGMEVSMRPMQRRERDAERRIAEAGGDTAAVGSTNRTMSGGTSAISRTSRGSISPASTSSRKSSSSRSSQKRDDGGTVPAPEHRCGKCERRFMTPQALISHEKFCSLQQMKPPQSVLLPKSPLNPRLRSETPEKRIAIQIRKDYKKPLSPASEGATDTKESAASDGTPLGQDVMSDSAAATKVEALMKKLCHLSSLTCVPCGRRYQTITTLKRHISVHFNWTRYACRRCTFRSYNRYELTRHATTQHGVTESAAADLLMEDVAFGPVKYSLTEAEASEGDEGMAVGHPVPLHVNSARVEVNGIASDEEDVESARPNTHTRTQDTTNAHTHAKPESASEINVPADTTDPKCREVPDTEEGQQNGSVMGEGSGVSAPSPHTPPLPPDGETEATGDAINKPKGGQESADISTNTQTDGRATDRPESKSERPKRNESEKNSSADTTKTRPGSKRQIEDQESYSEGMKRRKSPQDSSEDSTRTPDSGRKRESAQESYVNTPDSEGRNTESDPSSTNGKRGQECRESSKSSKTQSDSEPKLPAVKRRRKKLPRRRKQNNNHPSDGTETAHNTCNGTHGDARTNGSHATESTPPSASPLSTPQPPEAKGDEWRNVETTEVEENGAGKERKSGGNAGVEKGVTEGKQAVS